MTANSGTWCMPMRKFLTHSYQTRPGGYGPPPLHVYGQGHLPQAQYAGTAPALARSVHAEPAATGRGRLYGSGGLLGGAVTLGARAPVGMVTGGTGYGYLGMDPSDPLTWPRPFNPAPGMISWLNWQVRS